MEISYAYFYEIYSSKNVFDRNFFFGYDNEFKKVFLCFESYLLVEHPTMNLRF